MNYANVAACGVDLAVGRLEKAARRHAITASIRELLESCAERLQDVMLNAVVLPEPLPPAIAPRLVEDNIPLPTEINYKRSGAARSLNIPWADFKRPGQSYFIPAYTWTSRVPPRQAIAQVIEHQQRKGAGRFAMRTRHLDSDGEEGWRIWLVE